MKIMNRIKITKNRMGGVLCRHPAPAATAAAEPSISMLYWRVAGVIPGRNVSIWLPDRTFRCRLERSQVERAQVNARHGLGAG